MFELPGGRGQIVEPYVDSPGGPVKPAGDNHVSPFHRRMLHPLQVHRQPLARLARFRLGAVGLESAYPALQAAREDINLVADPDRPGEEGAGYHGPEARNGEDPVHGEAEGAVAPPLLRLGGQPRQFLAQGIESGAGPGRDRDDRRPLQKAGEQVFAHLFRYQAEPFRVHHVALGQGHQPLPDPQELADLQVFPGLGHDPLVGGDHQHDQVHAADPSHHGPDKAFVPRHVDDAELDVAGEFQVGEAEFDGDTPGLLLLQPVGVDAGEGLDQRGLAVVDVAGGAEDEVFHDGTP